MEIAIVVFTVFANLCLGFISYSKNPGSVTNRLLAFLNLILASWAITNYFSLNSSSAETTLFWIRAVMFVTAPLTPTLFLFLFAFPNRELRINKLVLFLITVVTILVAFSAYSPWMFSSVSLENGVNPVPGFGIVFYGLLTIGFLLVSFWIVFNKYRKTMGLQKLQMKYIILGAVITFTLQILTNFLIVVLFKLSSLVILGPTLSLVLIGFFSYAIIKHQLMDIRLVIARTIAYSMLVLFIGVFYAFASIVLSSFILGSNLGGNPLILYSLLTLVVALSFERLKKFIEKITDKIFFKGRYDSNQLLSKLGNILSTNIELESLSSQMLQTLTSEMRISRGVLVFLEKGAIYKISATGFNSPKSYTYNQLAPFIKEQLLVFDELIEGELKQLMRALNISVSVSLQVKEEKVGLLLLGEKASGETYSSEDLKVLEILSPEVAIAIQNAKSFDKIKKFNITLYQEVQRATADLQYANERLKKLDQLKDDFVSIASHELRTPMAAIRNYAWMALHRSDVPISEKVSKYLVRIVISTERLINLVNDMLNISRIESGRIEIKPEPLDMVSLFKDIIDEAYFSKSTAKNIKFVLLEQALPKVFADPEKLRQVLLNIMGNALKFSPVGGKITIGFLTDGKVVETHIKDQGPGIAKDDLGKLFQKFGRLDSTYVAAATTGGTGLGLFISKSLIEFMKGRIWCQSEGVGKGATFSFSLPVANAEVLKHADLYTFKVKGEVKSLEPVAI